MIFENIICYCYSISDVRLESRPENKSSLSVESSSSTSGFGSGATATGRTLTWTPPASVEGSTPTWTEGTPSFTESSSSGDIGMNVSSFYFIVHVKLLTISVLLKSRSMCV